MTVVPDGFARDWIESWNSRSLARILDHYAEEIVFRSPFVTKLTGSADGELRGRAAVREYFERALQAYPDLHFVLLGEYTGVGSIVLHYRSVNGLIAAETFQFDADGRISEVLAHYSAEDLDPDRTGVAPAGLR